MPLSDWTSYSAADFLMFSPDIYWRLFTSLNAAFWPAHLPLVGAGLLWLALQQRAEQPPSAVGLRIAALALAGCWALVAWAFLLQRFAPINWAASGFAALFIVEALLLCVMVGLAADFERSSGQRQRAGVALGLWALLGHPLLGLAFGRPWPQQAEVFGLAPDPTAIATLAFALLLRGRTTAARRLLGLLWLLPVLWCGVSGLMLSTMGTRQGWILFAAAPAVLLIGVLATPRFRSARPTD